MQTISDALRLSLSRPTPVYTKTIELYRQAWNGSAYVYDDALDITGYLTENSNGVIMWKLDKEQYGVFNLDNVTLTFRNDRNQWKQDNPKGLFPSGKLINNSKVVIKIGAQLADGTMSTLRSFTGYIAGDPDYNPEEKNVTMTLVSALSIFEKNNAEEISTLVTDELMGQDSGTEFTTANNGVGIIVMVKRGTTLAGATEIKPTTGYTASDMNKPDLPLKITLVTGLTPGEKTYCSYRYWYQDKTLEWLVEQIMVKCGIATYSISAAVFSSSIENTWDFNSQENWDTCSKENIDTITSPGSFKIGLIDDFGDGDFSANPEWTVLYGSIFSIDGGRLRMDPTTPLSTIKTAMSQTVGSWQFRLYPWSTFTLNDYCNVWFMATGEEATYKYPTAGYYLNLTVSATKIKRADGTVLINVAETPNNSTVIRIERSSAGVIKLYFNEVLKGTSAADTTYGTSDRFAISAFEIDDSWALTFFFDDFYYWADGTTVGTGVLTSPVKDCGTSLSSWGNLTATYTGNSASVTIETASSADNSTWDDWTAIGSTGEIQSALQRYIKFRITAALSSLTNPVTPVFDQIYLKYYTSATTIDLVNLTGMSCKAALDRATEMPAYEVGFRADDSFVYRSRITGVSPVMELRSDTNIKTVRNLSDGIDRVYNRVVAEFGIYKKVADASTDTEPNSITKYGTREYPVSTSNLLPADNVNLAYAVAPTILAYTKTPRRRCTIETQFILHLELGDKVTVYYDEPQALRQWKWGDTDVVYGQGDLEYYDSAALSSRLNLWGVVMRVEGVEFDFQNWTTSFDLVEVI